MAIKLEEVRKAKELPPIVKKPTDPAAGQRPKREQVAINKKHKEAAKAADEAYKKTMAAYTPANTALEEAKSEVIKYEQIVKTRTDKIAELQTELNEVPDSEKRSIKMQIGKIKRQLEEATEKLEEVKDNEKQLKEEAK